MFNGSGIQTPRGSGTNGYIQRNKFFVKPSTKRQRVLGSRAQQGSPRNTTADRDVLLEHERKRLIELKIVILEDTLINHGYTEAEIAEKLEEVRENLQKNSRI